MALPLIREAADTARSLTITTRRICPNAKAIDVKSQSRPVLARFHHEHGKGHADNRCSGCPRGVYFTPFFSGNLSIADASLRPPQYFLVTPTPKSVGLNGLARATTTLGWCLPLPTLGQRLCTLSVYPSDDTRLITQAALAGLEQIYRTGYAFSKAEVLLLDLCQRGEYTADLFASTQPEASRQVMAVLDAVNAKWGRGTLRPGVVPPTPGWGMKREMMSRSFTTDIDALWRVGG